MQGLVGQLAKPPCDEIEPEAGNRGETQLEPGAIDQPLLDFIVLVGRRSHPGSEGPADRRVRSRFDGAQEDEELCAPQYQRRHCLLLGNDLKCREQGRGSAPLVVRSHGPGRASAVTRAGYGLGPQGNRSAVLARRKSRLFLSVIARHNKWVWPSSVECSAVPRPR